MCPMATSTAEIEHLMELLAPLGTVTARRMFGGWGLYVDGSMLAIVVEGEPLLKVDALTRERFEQAGCRPFVYRARGREIPMSYWSVPEEALDSADAMRPWALLAQEAARRKPLGKPRAKKAGSAR